MKVLLIGHMGNMGKRYAAILNHLNVPWIGHDLKSKNPFYSVLKECTHFIIATPTDSHIRVINDLLTYEPGTPILCEKPISKNIKDVKKVLKRVAELKTPFDVVMQYKHLPAAYLDDSYSYYDYFKHGNDGLAWDCYQIIALSKTKPVIKEESPIWRCQINGCAHFLGDMDNAYISFIKNWLENPHGNIKEIYKHHLKVNNYDKSMHRNTGPEHI